MRWTTASRGMTCGEAMSLFFLVIVLLVIIAWLLWDHREEGKP